MSENSHVTYQADMYHSMTHAHIRHSMTHIEWDTWHVSSIVFRWHMSMPHTCLSQIADMSDSMTHLEWRTWHASSSVFQSHTSIAYMYHSNDTCRYLTCVFRITFYCPVTITCHKLHLWQAYVTKTCMTHVLDNRLARDIVVTRQSTGTNRPSAVINSVT